MVLSDLKNGERAKIKNMQITAQIKLRLYHLGVTEGVSVTLIRRAPFLDPIQIKVRDFYLAVRKNVADKIEIEYEY